MKQRLAMLFVFFGLLALLIGLNAATYVQKEKVPDTELDPNRSSFNSGATGTQAFFTLLAESGRRPLRWREPPDALLAARNKPATLVMIGTLRRPISDDEAASLLKWVAEGGRLVVIDRDPPAELVTTTANWKLSVSSDPAMDLFSIDPSDQRQMTTGTGAAKPVQPSIFTAAVNAVQPSRFAGWVNFERVSQPTAEPGSSIYERPASGYLAGPLEPYTMPTPTPVEVEQLPEADIYEAAFKAPVVHVAGNQKNLLVDTPFGAGRIVYLADPYIVSNAGIKIVDNAQLAINVVSGGGTIAFDEYHQGYGSNANRFLQFFEGTPVVAMFLQVILLVALIFYSQSRRFARPLPDDQPDRLSKLEYVAAMAELQQRTRAYDLAIENIYSDFRRRAARSFGVDNLTSTRQEIARLIAERTGLDPENVQDLMFRCEEIIHGEPAGRTEVITLVGRIREIEQKLGLSRKPRRV